MSNRVYLYLLIIAGATLFFYAAVPGYGAFVVRRRWRRFRARMVAASLLPTMHYGNIAPAKGDRFIGLYRFIGALEAIQGSDTVWISDGTMSVSVELRGVGVYVLPSVSQEDEDDCFEPNAELFTDEMPQHLPWSRISTLPEGTRLVVSGSVYSERGHAVFRAQRTSPLTVVLFDGDEHTVLRRSIWSGRQRNEYWNQLTLLSLLAGAISQLVLVYYLSREPMLRAAASLAFVGGIFPIVPFLPPGILFFFLYRYLWRIGRVRRAERDLLSLPVRYFNEEHRVADRIEVRLPDGEPYALLRASTHDQARALAPGAKIRSASVLPSQVGYYSLLGTPSSGLLSRPSDPLAEFLMIPGDPWELSRSCARSARVFELAATFMLAAGVVINVLIVLMTLANWIR